MTRPHNDIDMLIWGKDADHVRLALRGLGYRVEDDSKYPDEMFHAYTDDQRISFTFLEWNDLRQIITPGRWADWPWPEGSFSSETVTLEDVVRPVQC